MRLAARARFCRVVPCSRYGPVEVRGDRVQVGWKSMRVLNGAQIRCLEPCGEGRAPQAGDLRVMHGSEGKSSVFIFRSL